MTLLPNQQRRYVLPFSRTKAFRLGGIRGKGHAVIPVHTIKWSKLTNAGCVPGIDTAMEFPELVELIVK